jgi:hypothetical protein
MIYNVQHPPLAFKNYNRWFVSQTENFYSQSSNQLRCKVPNTKLVLCCYSGETNLCLDTLLLRVIWQSPAGVGLHSYDVCVVLTEWMQPLLRFNLLTSCRRNQNICGHNIRKHKENQWEAQNFGCWTGVSLTLWERYKISLFDNSM